MTMVEPAQEIFAFCTSTYVHIPQNSHNSFSSRRFGTSVQLTRTPTNHRGDGINCGRLVGVAVLPQLSRHLLLLVND